MLSEKVIEMLKTQPDLIWEAIGIDGMTYTFDDSRFDKTKEERELIQERVNYRDNDQITSIAGLILAADDADTLNIDVDPYDAVLGSIVRNQITDYLKTVEERENG